MAAQGNAVKQGTISVLGSWGSWTWAEVQGASLVPDLDLQNNRAASLLTNFSGGSRVWHFGSRLNQRLPHVRGIQAPDFFRGLWNVQLSVYGNVYVLLRVCACYSWVALACETSTQCYILKSF